jgi:hypothetical protein
MSTFPGAPCFLGCSSFFADGFFFCLLVDPSSRRMICVSVTLVEGSIGIVRRLLKRGVSSLFPRLFYDIGAYSPNGARAVPVTCATVVMNIEKDRSCDHEGK